MKKLLALVTVVCLLSGLLCGCSDKDSKVTEAVGEGYAFNEMGNTVEDSSDLPDWNGKKMELRFWYATGTGSAKKLKEAENDVVTPEIYRVTGIKYSETDSFDNGGELMDAKIAKIMAANDWPDIVFEPEKAVLEKMIEADMVYDLTEYIPQYCPNIVAMASKGGENNYLKSDRSDGKRYLLPVSVSLSYAAPEIEANTMARVIAPEDPYDYVYVRDDILTTIYPEAKTQDEIEEIFVKNGRFTKEEIFDVPIETKEEFFEFLRNIKALGLKAGNYDVFPTYVADGYDNWSLLTNFGSLYGYSMNKSNGANYFTYWDKESQKVEYMFKQPVFKEALKDWTDLVREGIASAESLIDNRATFEQKVHNGVYAVLYGATLPEQNQLNNNLTEAGKGFKYRKVYLKIPANQDKYLFRNANVAGSNVAILKNQIKEEDLPQVLRFFDFALSDAGQKLAYWGPRSAGLFTEEDGKRVYTDKELEANMVYDEPNDKMVYYGLANSSWPGYPFMSGSKYNPKVIYDMQPKASMAKRYFASGIVEHVETTTAIAPDIWKFDAYGIKNVQKFWQSRQTFENALKKVFIAKSDEEFEKLYKEMISLAEKNGLTASTLEEINKVYREVVNADYMSNLK